MTVGDQDQDPLRMERLLDQLDAAMEAPSQNSGDAAALQTLLGKRPDEPKRPRNVENVRASLEMLLRDAPPELGRAALQALDTEYSEAAATDRQPQWTAGPGLMQVLGAAEPLSTLALERQIDAAAEAEKAAEHQLEQERQNRAMLVALLQGLADGEEDADRLLEESDPAGAKRRRKRDRRRVRAAELLKLYGSEHPPEDLSAGELSNAVAWLYEGEARSDQRAALDQLMDGSAADKLLAHIDDLADVVRTPGADEWGDAGAVGRLLAPEEASLEDGITLDMVHRILTQDSAQGVGSDGRFQAEGGWRRLVGDSDSLWSDGQPPAQMPSAYADSLQVLGVLPLPGGSRADQQSASDHFECEVDATGDGDVLRLLGISDQPEPKLPRGARNLNDLLGHESDLLKLLAEPFDDGGFPPWVPTSLQQPSSSTAPRGSQHSLPPQPNSFGRTLRTFDLAASALPESEVDPELRGQSVPTARTTVIVGDWLVLCCCARRDTATGYWSVLGFDDRVLEMHAPMHWLPPTQLPGGRAHGGANRQVVRFAARRACSETTVSLQLHRGGGGAAEEVVRVNLKVSVEHASGVTVNDPRFDPLKEAAAARRQAEQDSKALDGLGGADDMPPDEIAQASQAASQGALRTLAVILREVSVSDSMPGLALSARLPERESDNIGKHLFDATDSRFANSLVPLAKNVIAAQQLQEHYDTSAEAQADEVDVDEDGYPLPLVALVREALAKAAAEAAAVAVDVANVP